ncbi:hypothetical protein D3C74_455810 [compost metagenome]
MATCGGSMRSPTALPTAPAVRSRWVLKTSESLLAFSLTTAESLLIRPTIEWLRSVDRLRAKSRWTR